MTGSLRIPFGDDARSRTIQQIEEAESAVLRFANLAPGLQKAVGAVQKAKQPFLNDTTGFLTVEEINNLARATVHLREVVSAMVASSTVVLEEVVQAETWATSNYHRAKEYLASAGGEKEDPPKGEDPAPSPPEPPTDPPEDPKPAPLPPEDPAKHPIIRHTMTPGPLGRPHRGSASWDFGHLPEGLRERIKPVPFYEIPTRADCHYIITDDRVDAEDGTYWPRLHPNADSIRDCYRDFTAKGGKGICRIGLDCGNAGRAQMGGQHGVNDPWSVVDHMSHRNVKIDLVGLREDAEVSVGWASQFAYVEHLGLYNLFLRGAKDSFAIRATRRHGRIFIDGCTMLEHPEITAKWKASGRTADYTSGLHIVNYLSLVVANMDQTRTKNGSLPVKFIEHNLYPKGSRQDGLYVLHNRFQGGNRTATQQRPDGPADQSFPESALGHRGPIVFMGNYSEDYGFDHAGNNGGQWLTAWQAPLDIVVFALNKLVNGKYGGLAASAQEDYRNVYGPSGRPIAEAHFWANDIDTKASARPSIVCSGVGEIHLWGLNKISPGSRPFEIDSRWSHDKHGIKSGDLFIYAEGDLVPHRYNPETDKVEITGRQVVKGYGQRWVSTPDGIDALARAVESRPIPNADMS